MTGKTESQLRARMNLSERLLNQAEKAIQQLEGTLSTFTLVMASIALKNGGKYRISEEEINAASGIEFRIEKDDEGRAIILHVGDSKLDNTAVVDPDTNEELPFDPGKPPTKLEHPFIMEEEGLNPPEMGQSGVKLTDL